MVTLPHLFARRAGVLALLVSLIGAALLLSSPRLVPAADAAETLTTSADHPYGDPLWLPVHTPSRVGCAKSACDTGKGHGYWAVDFIGGQDDPVYAAGAGIAHVGGTSGSCTSKDVTDGRWIWIDHGAGVVTRYHHLNSISVKEGQRVTPATRIGGMGHSGDLKPCSTNYLHFEVRDGGLKGSRVDPGFLLACVQGRTTNVVASLGASGWDDPVLHPRGRVGTPASDTSCISPTWLTSPAAPSLRVVRGDRQAVVSWPASSAGADQVTVMFETYHPSVKNWGIPVYRQVPATATSTTFTGLENGRTYRVSAAVHSSAGTSRHSSTTSFVPAGKPAAPRSPRYLTWPKKDYVHYGWYRPAASGSGLTSFTAARRCSTKNGSYGAWKSYQRGTKDLYYNFRGLSAYAKCQVKVKATNTIGTSGWSKTSTVKR